MNNTFSFNRFSLLFKKHTTENLKTYLLSIAVLIGILCVSLGFFALSNQGRLAIPAQAVLFIFCLGAAGSIFTSLSFTELGDKRKAPGMLTLPASHLEKYLVGWIYSFIIFQIIFVGMFYAVDWTIIQLSSPPVDFKNKLINVFDKEQSAYIAFFVFALFHGFTFWGSIFFEKLHFIKTAFIFFIGLVVIFIITEPLLRMIIGTEVHGSPFSTIFVKMGDYQRITSTDNMDKMSLVIFCLFIFLLWLSAFFRLKEKEI